MAGPPRPCASRSNSVLLELATTQAASLPREKIRFYAHFAAK
jgi:hypothetical protein